MVSNVAARKPASANKARNASASTKRSWATATAGEGAVRLIRVQREGKAQQSADEMLRGFDVPVGTILGGPRSEGSAFSTRRGLD